MSIEDLIQHLNDHLYDFPVLLPGDKALEKYIHLERGGNGSPTLAFLPSSTMHIRQIFMLLNDFKHNAVIFSGNTGLVSAQRANHNAVIDLTQLSQLHALWSDGHIIHRFDELTASLSHEKKAIHWQKELSDHVEALRHYSDISIECDAGVPLGSLNFILEPLEIEIPLDTGAVWMGGGMSIGGGLANATHGGYGLLHGTLCDLALEVESIQGDGEERRETRPLPDEPAHHPERCTINSAIAQYGDSALGTQGTFALITRARLRTTPIPKGRYLFLIKHTDITHIHQMRTLLSQQFAPHFRQCELMDRHTLHCLKTHMPDHYHNPFTDDGGQPLDPTSEIDSAYTTLIEMVSPYADDDLGERIFTLLTQDLPIAPHHIAYASHQHNDPERLMAIRHAVSEASTRYARQYGNPAEHRLTPDLCVPTIHIDAFESQLRQTIKSLGLELMLFGHIGIGAFHAHIFSKETITSPKKWEILREIYSITRQYHGSCWSEHGIGTANAALYHEFTDEQDVNIWRDLIQRYDPNNILQPEANHFFT